MVTLILRYLHGQSAVLPCAFKRVCDLSAYNARSLHIDLCKGSSPVKRILADDSDISVDHDPLQVLTTIKFFSFTLHCQFVITFVHLRLSNSCFH